MVSKRLSEYHPETEEQVTNRQWVLDELKDLERAIGFVREAIPGVMDFLNPRWG